MSIKNSIIKVINETVLNEKSYITELQRSKIRKEIIIKGFDYVLNRLQPIIDNDLNFIESSYQKGLNNDSDGVFLVEIHGEKTLAFSKEVAEHLGKNGKFFLKKLEEEEVVTLIISFLDDASNVVFASNIKYLDLFNEERKKEVINVYRDLLPSNLLDKTNLSADNLFPLFADNRYSVDNRYSFNKLNLIDLEKRLTSINNNTTDEGYVYNQSLMRKLGFRANKKSYYYSSDNKIEGFLFNQSAQTYVQILYEAIDRAKELYKSENMELLIVAIKSVREYLDFHNQREYANKYTENIFNNIEKFKSIDIDDLLDVMKNSLFINNLKVDFYKKIESFDKSRLAQVDISYMNPISLWIMGALNDWKYETKNLFIKVIKEEDFNKYQLSFDETKKVMYLANDFRFQDIFIHVCRELNMDINELYLTKDKKKVNGIEIRVPKAIKVEDIMEFCRLKCVQYFKGENFTKINDITSNEFYEYLLKEKIKKLEDDKVDISRIKRKI